MAAQESNHPLRDLGMIVKIVVSTAIEDEQFLGLGRGLEQAPAVAGRHGFIARAVKHQQRRPDAPEPKELLILDGGAHNDLYDHPQVAERVIAFLRRHAPAAD